MPQSWPPGQTGSGPSGGTWTSSATLSTPPLPDKQVELIELIDVSQEDMTVCCFFNYINLTLTVQNHDCFGNTKIFRYNHLYN